MGSPKPPPATSYGWNQGEQVYRRENPVFTVKAHFHLGGLQPPMWVVHPTQDGRSKGFKAKGDAIRWARRLAKMVEPSSLEIYGENGQLQITNHYPHRGNPGKAAS